MFHDCIQDEKCLFGCDSDDEYDHVCTQCQELRAGLNAYELQQRAGLNADELQQLKEAGPEPTAEERRRLINKIVAKVKKKVTRKPRPKGAEQSSRVENQEQGSQVNRSEQSSQIENRETRSPMNRTERSSRANRTEQSSRAKLRREARGG